jgi:hypothetical protein
VGWGDENYVFVNLNSNEHINSKGFVIMSVEASADSAKKNLEAILAKEIDCAWKSEKSALQVLAEMRRCC